jgi:hypothetical protein
MSDETMRDEIQRMLDGGVNFYKTSSVGASSYASSTVSNAFLTIEDLQKAMKPILEALKEPDQLLEWMKNNGCDPDLGWVLMVSPEENVWAPLNPPWYVRVSNVVPHACLIHAPHLNPPRLKPIEPLKYRIEWRF